MIDYTEDDNSGKYQSCSPSTCSFSENVIKEKSDFEIVVEGRPLHVDQIHISPKDLHDYMKISLLEEDDQPSDLKGDGCTDLFLKNAISLSQFLLVKKISLQSKIQIMKTEWKLDMLKMTVCCRVFLHLSG